eukprot:7843786-Pyramimonas_sp.AAC.1
MALQVVRQGFRDARVRGGSRGPRLRPAPGLLERRLRVASPWHVGERLGDGGQGQGGQGRVGGRG